MLKVRVIRILEVQGPHEPLVDHLDAGRETLDGLVIEERALVDVAERPGLVWAYGLHGYGLFFDLAWY